MKKRIIFFKIPLTYIILAQAVILLLTIIILLNNIFSRQVNLVPILILSIVLNSGIISYHFYALKIDKLIYKCFERILDLTRFKKQDKKNMTAWFKDFDNFLKKYINFQLQFQVAFTNQFTNCNNKVKMVAREMKAIKEQVSKVYDFFDKVNSDNSLQRNIVRGIIDEIQLTIMDIGELRSFIGKQTSRINKITQEITNMAGSLNELNNDTDKANNTSNNLFKTSTQGKNLMQKTNQNMDTVLNSIKAIKDFVTVIKKIASKTNMLAINANIEAAHAGKFGVGFAVVAEEIRNLSEMANSEAVNAKNALDMIISSVNTTTNDLDESNKQFQLLLTESKNVSEIVNHIKQFTSKQAGGVNQIKDEISSIVSISQTLKDNSLQLDKNSNKAMESFTSLNDSSIKTSDGLNQLLEYSKDLDTKIKIILENIDAIYNMEGNMEFLWNDFVKILEPETGEDLVNEYDNTCINNKEKK